MYPRVEKEDIRDIITIEEIIYFPHHTYTILLKSKIAYGISNFDFHFIDVEVEIEGVIKDHKDLSLKVSG